MTRTRRSWRPSARSRTVRPSVSAAKAASGASVGRAGGKDIGDPCGGDLATDNALACVGLQTIDPRRLVRQPLPDRQQQARDDVDRALGEFGNARKLRLPGGGKAFSVGFEPMAFRHHPQGNAVLLHRADQPHSAFNLTVVEHEARRRNLHRGPVGALVDQQDGTLIRKTAEGVIQGHWMISLTLDNREEPRFGAGRRMNINCPPISDDKALGAQRFQPDVIGAGCDRTLDASGQQPLERREENVLQLDGERQQPVQEGRDRRKLILDAVRINELQSRRVFEHLERAALDLAAGHEHIELAQRITPVLAFEIVLGPEQALPPGLSLTARDGA